MNEEIVKRIQSLLWRVAAASGVAGLATLVGGLPDLEQAGAPVIVTALVALVAGEITKTLNKKYQLGKGKK